MTLRILSLLSVAILAVWPLAATVTAQTVDADSQPLLLSRPLYIGISGSDVADLQRFLKSEGLFSHPRITGFFGTITKDSVTRFQNNNGIDPIGEVGPLTRLALTIRSLQKILAHIGPANSLAAVGPLASTTSATSTIVSATSTPVVPIYRGGSGGSVDTTTAPSTVDSAAPVISSISADKTSTTATISWTTDEAANSQVNYGTTISYGTASSSAALATSHAITLSGLTDNTIYHFQVQSVDAQGNTAASSDQTFTSDYDTDAVALFSAMSSAPNSARKNLINTLITELKSDGVWSKLSIFQVYAADAAQAATLNWINPGSGPTASVVNAPSFATDKGWPTNGTSEYINSGWNPGTDADWAPDAGGFGFWSNYGGHDAEMGLRTTVSGALFSVILNVSATNSEFTEPVLLHGRAYSGGQWLPGTPTTPQWLQGSHMLVGTSGNTQRYYADGVLRATTTSYPSTAEGSRELWAGARNHDGSPSAYFETSFGGFWVFKEIPSDSDAAAFHAALSSYMSAIANEVTPLVGWGDSLSSPSAYWYFGAGEQSDETGRSFRRFVQEGVSGEHASHIATRMLADTQYHDHIQVIWAGRNDINNNTQTVDSASVLANVADMVEAALERSGKYLVIGVTNGNINAGFVLANSEAVGTPIHTAVVSLNAELETLYGDHFLDIRELVVAEGANGGADDQADAALDVPPRHLMSDDIHFSPLLQSPYTISGGRLIGRQIELKLQALEY